MQINVRPFKSKCYSSNGTKRVVIKMSLKKHVVRKE